MDDESYYSFSTLHNAFSSMRTPAYGLDILQVSTSMAMNLGILPQIMPHLVKTEFGKYPSLRPKPFRTFGIDDMMSEEGSMDADAEREFEEEYDTADAYMKTFLMDWPRMELWILGCYYLATVHRIRANEYTVQWDDSWERIDHLEDDCIENDWLRCAIWRNHQGRMTNWMKNYLSCGMYVGSSYYFTDFTGMTFGWRRMPRTFARNLF